MENSMKPRKLCTPLASPGPRGACTPRAQLACPLPPSPPSHFEPGDLPPDLPVEGSHQANTNHFDAHLLALRDEFESLQKSIEKLKIENKRLHVTESMPRSWEDTAAKVPWPQPCYVMSSYSPWTHPNTNSNMSHVSAQYESTEQHSSFGSSHGTVLSSTGDACGESPVGAAEPIRCTSEGKLSKARSLTVAFNVNERDCKTRGEKAAKLKPWFERLTLHNDGGLTVAHLHDIVQRVHGREVLSIADIAQVVHGITSVASNAFDLDSSSATQSGRRCGLSQVSLADIALNFTAFADMILLDRADGIVGAVKNSLVIVRNAVMRTHIDEVVSHYARIPMTETASVPLHERPVWIDRFLDPCMGAVILVNGFVIGASSDIAWGGWEVIEVGMTCIFIVELAIRLACLGVCRYFFGPDWSWNWFDLVLVAMTCTDASLSVIAGGNVSTTSEFSLARVVRIARLARVFRIIRVLRLSIFKELLLMVKGVVGGMRTLFWAFVMLLAMVYVCSVLLRQTVGQDEHEMQDKYRTVLFGSVPWSMFTTFRCFMYECTLPDGTPIAGHLYELYGYSFVIPYSVMAMFITFGIFNLVTALFVENVLEAAKQKELMTKEAEQVRVGQLLSQLVVQIASKPIIEDDVCAKGSLSRVTSAFKPKVGSNVIHGEVACRDFAAALRNPDVQRILEKLEVNASNGHNELFDVLDSDANGSLELPEIISGIMQMRSGDVGKDIVALRLSTRTILKKLEQIVERIDKEFVSA